MNDRSNAVPPARDAGESDPYAGAVALAAFNGVFVGAAGCAAAVSRCDAGTAYIAGVGALVCLAIWERHLLGSDGTQRR